MRKMMSKNKIASGHFVGQNPFLLLRTSLNILIQNPVILFPTALLALIQLCIIEVLYFAPQLPLSHFFSPLIRQVWSEEYLHYPLNLVLLPKMFYYAQMFIFLFCGAFLLALSVKIIVILNVHSRVNLRVALKETMGSYVHIFVAALLSFFLYQILAKGCIELLSTFIRLNGSGQGFYFLQRIFLWIIPYLQFFMGILATTFLTYVIPVIIIDNEKIFKAILKNFKVLVRTFPLTLFFVTLPTLLYLPVLTIRNNISVLMNMFTPEVQIFVLIFGLGISMAIDLLVITSSAILYLFIREIS